MLKRKISGNPDIGKADSDRADGDIAENTETGNDGFTGLELDDMPEWGGYIEPDEMAGAPDEMDGETAILQRELSEAQDKYLRLAADFDNYRKRTLREKAELIQTAGEALLKDMLPVVDDFERGLDVASKAEDMDAMKAGMELIYNKLKEFLANHGVKEIKAVNEPFDTDRHEAVTNIPAPDDMKGKVVDVIQKGYTLNDKVMRYSKVVVGE